MAKITQSELKQVLSYDSTTGYFTWLVQSGSAKPGHKACVPNAQGYIAIQLQGVKYLAPMNQPAINSGECRPVEQERGSGNRRYFHPATGRTSGWLRNDDELDTWLFVLRVATKQKRG